MLPDSIAYNPLDYIDLNRGIFIGLDKDDQPQYITAEEFQTQHADLIGTTGSGKGVSACVLLYQAILAGEGVFVEDPKMMSGHRMYCGKLVRKREKFVLINLNDLNFQLDLLADISHEQLEELFNAGFSTGKKAKALTFIVLPTVVQPEIRQLFMKGNDVTRLI